MIIKKNNEIVIESDLGEGVEASIDLSAISSIIGFVSNMYEDNIGSIVREITSNCFDSHRKKNTSEAVIVRKKWNVENSSYDITFKDVGVGMNPDTMINIYSQYFNSTKRQSNLELGGFGLGSKSPLSYVDYFYITTWHNKRKYSYIYTKTDTLPTLLCLDGYLDEPVPFSPYVKLEEGDIPPAIQYYKYPLSEPSTEKNGSEITFEMQSADLFKFRNSLLKQLCYFENVYFDNWNISNSYKIYESETFRIRDDYMYSEQLHIVIDQVAYPVNFELLGRKEIKLPIAVKIPVGSVEIQLTRENIVYSNDTIKILNSYIDKAVKDIVERLNNSVFETSNLSEYIEYIKKPKTRKLKIAENVEFEVTINDLGLDEQIVKRANIKLNKGNFKKIKFSPFGEADAAFEHDEDVINLIDSFFSVYVINGNKVIYETGLNRLKLLHRTFLVLKKGETITPLDAMYISEKYGVYKYIRIRSFRSFYSFLVSNFRYFQPAVSTYGALSDGEVTISFLGDERKIVKTEKGYYYQVVEVYKNGEIVKSRLVSSYVHVRDEDVVECYLEKITPVLGKPKQARLIYDYFVKNLILNNSHITTDGHLPTEEWKNRKRIELKEESKSFIKKLKGNVTVRDSNGYRREISKKKLSEYTNLIYIESASTDRCKELRDLRKLFLSISSFRNKDGFKNPKMFGFYVISKTVIKELKKELTNLYDFDDVVTNDFTKSCLQLIHENKFIWYSEVLKSTILEAVGKSHPINKDVKLLKAELSKIDNSDLPDNRHFPHYEFTVKEEIVEAVDRIRNLVEMAPMLKYVNSLYLVKNNDLINYLRMCKIHKLKSKYLLLDKTKLVIRKKGEVNSLSIF